MQKDAIRLGLIYGAISILLMTIVAYTDPKGMVSFSHWSTILGYILMIGFAYFAAKKARDNNGGFIPFGEALVPSFLTLAIAGLIGIVYMFLLTNFINPDLQSVLNEAALEMSDSMIDAMGGTEEMKLQAREEAEKQQAGSSQFGIVQSLLGWLVSLIFPTLPIAAIIAAIVKKKEPMPVV